MDNAAIEAVLRSLEPYTWGWLVVLPGIVFAGRTVGLRVDTQPIPTGGPSPPLDATEVSLVRLVLGGLSTLLPEIESKYRGHADSPDTIVRAHEPHVWLSRDILAEEGPHRWSFVIGISDAPDWTIQAVFDGLTFQTIWSGD